MSRVVFDSLKEWNQKPRTAVWATVREFKKDVQHPDKTSLTAVVREVERCARLAATDLVYAAEQDWTGTGRANRLDLVSGPDLIQTAEWWDWNPEVASPSPEIMALGRVVAFNGDVAECAVVLDGLELPRVGFPAWVIKQKGLDVGGRFIWIMRDGSRVRAADIDAEIPQTDELTIKELAELDRLYDKFQRRQADDSGEWPEYTGPGR